MPTMTLALVSHGSWSTVLCFYMPCVIISECIKVGWLGGGQGGKGGVSMGLDPR